MEFRANDRLRLRIRRSAHKAGWFEPPLPSPSGGRLDSSKVTRRPAAPKGWLSAGGLIPRSSRWPPSGGLIPGRGVACYARATAKSAVGEPRAAHGTTGTATRFLPSASGAPSKLPPNPGICPPNAPRIVLTKPKESGHRYKIFINVTHPALWDTQKYYLTNSLSTTSEFPPLPKKQKKWDNLRQNGTSIAPPPNPPAPQPPNVISPSRLPTTNIWKGALWGRPRPAGPFSSHLLPLTFPS